VRRWVRLVAAVGAGQEKTATWCCRRWCADGLASSWLREGGTGNRICSYWGRLSLIHDMMAKAL
jgi:hypothetical protein